MSGRARFGALAATLVALLVVMLAYAPSARRDGDLGLARGALEGLTFMQQASGGSATSTDYSNALEDNFFAIDLFLHSDSRDRLAGVAAPVDDSWLAYLVADQLWRAQEDGVDQPLVDGVYASGRLLKTFPEMRAYVSGQGAAARFDDRDRKAITALFASARQRRAAAAAALAAAGGRR